MRKVSPDKFFLREKAIDKGKHLTVALTCSIFATLLNNKIFVKRILLREYTINQKMRATLGYTKKSQSLDILYAKTPIRSLL